jgi:glycosyltransferase involved in cell wall biosynthesis
MDSQTTMKIEKPKASIVIPIYNEGKALSATLEKLLAIANGLDWEIIAVNDGSTDNSHEILARFDKLTIIDHPFNKGYGAALKSGIRRAAAEIVVTFDADGQHNPADIPSLLQAIRQSDMVAGQRTKNSANDWIRRPGKFILGKVANVLAETKIPDLNCGLRAFKKDIILGMLDILPDGFSFSTTSTIAFFKLGLTVTYIPITTSQRVGKSSVKQVKHGPQILLLILRLITLFSPLRIFLNVASAFFVIGIAYQIEEIVRRGLHIVNGAVLMIIAAILIFLFGLIADQISGLRLTLIRSRFQGTPSDSN